MQTEKRQDFLKLFGLNGGEALISGKILILFRNQTKIIHCCQQFHMLLLTLHVCELIQS